MYNNLGGYVGGIGEGKPTDCLDNSCILELYLLRRVGLMN